MFQQRMIVAFIATIGSAAGFIGLTVSIAIAGTGPAAAGISAQPGGGGPRLKPVHAPLMSAEFKAPLARTAPEGRVWASWAYDRALHEAVLFGGDTGYSSGPDNVLGTTWTWTPSGGWAQQHPAASPSARTGAAMVYDSATRQLVLFGGSARPSTSGGFTSDTWTWNGTTWTQLHPATSPSARHNADMIYDRASHQVIMFGGYNGQYLGDTWAWNGASWTQLHPVTSPPPMDSESLAYDPRTRKAILFGGFNGTRLDGTWAWNGTTWTEVHPATSPGVVTTAWQAAWYGAREQLILLGGDFGNGRFSNDTWEWTGSTWTRLNPAATPVPRGYGSLLYDPDRHRLILFGGGTGTTDPAAIWEWNGTWLRPPAEAAGPSGRGGEALAYDPALDELVLFGGNNASAVFADTWTRAGATWTEQHPARSPSPRTGAAMVYDPAARQLLLFGGSSKPGTQGGFHADTWVWTGATWRMLHPATSPPARHNAQMTYDAASHDVIMFGGYNGRYLGDTWTWNGTTWTQATPAASPRAGDGDSMAYDPASQTVILYGGFNGTTASSDTWSWNGTTWTLLHPATSPGPTTFGSQAAYDTASNQLILFGGAHYNHTNGRATWQWTGTTWKKLHPATSPPGQNGGATAYNAATQQIILFGGEGPTQTTYPTATWAWDGNTWQRSS